MADPTLDPFPYEPIARLETALARLRYVVIAVLIVTFAGFTFLGFQVRRLDGRIDALSAKVDGIDTTFGVKFDETSAKLDATSQRLAVELKTMETELTAQTNALAKRIATASSIAAPPPAGQPAPAPTQPRPSPVQPPRGRP